MKLSIKFFGEPRLFCDNHEVFIPPKKQLAVFLYLVYNKTCNRDDIISKFWCDYSETSARQNLRNTIYGIKQNLGDNIIVTKGNSYIQISPDIEIIRDIDVFVTENNAKALLELQDLVFMDNLYLSQCEGFEQWKSEIQRTYTAIFFDRLEAELQTSLRLGNLDYAEKFSEKLIALDSYDEGAVRTLMKIYLQQGSYSKGLKLFSQLEARLHKELNISPDQETQELHQQFLQANQIKENTGDNVNFFFGRVNESISLGREYEKYICGVPYKHCIISGGIGCGKSGLIHAFIQSKQIVDLLDFEFELVTKAAAYSAIHQIVRQLFPLLHFKPSKAVDSESSSTYFTLAIETIQELLTRQNRKLVLVLRNMEAIDQESMGILSTCFLGKLDPHIFFVGELCPNFLADSRFISMLQLLPMMLTLPIQYLSERETADFLDCAVGKDASIQLQTRKIYALTQGNLLFLQDVLAQLKKNPRCSLSLQESSRNKIRLFVLSLSPDELQMMEVLSLFENGITVDMAAALMGLSMVGTLEILNRLVNRRVVEQVRYTRHTLLRISDHMIQSTVHGDMQDFKKLQLHKMAAEIYEGELSKNARDYFYISELKHHYAYSDNAYKSLYFTLEHMEYVLDYSDQFFPTLRPLAGEKIDFHINRDEVYSLFYDCEQKILELENLLGAAELCELKMKFSFLIGRTLNRDGKREQGVVHIKQLIVLSKKLHREDYLLKAYLEMTYYGLKNDNAVLMEEYLKKTSTIKNLSVYEIEQGIIDRLWGLVYIQKQEYSIAEEWLWKSIHLFESPHLYNQNFINIAAAYAYMGYAYRHKAEYQSAEYYFLKAIGICEDKGIKKSLDLFYVDLGYNYYLKGDYGQAEECLEKSSRLYDEFGTYWMRSIAESCLVMICLRKCEFQKAVEHFHRAEIFSRKDSVKEEMLVLEQARAQMAAFKLL